jgi:hypothetical protein
MSEQIEPSQIIRVEEPTPVQLTRMEGVLNLVLERVVNVNGRVDKHEREITENRDDIAQLKSLTQTLKEGADADKKTAVALALALKEADETRRTKSESTWSPITRLFAILTGIATIVGIYFAITPH